MKIAVIGTGMVGQALAGRLSVLGHDVVIGTRDVAVTLARKAPDARGAMVLSKWLESHSAVRVLSFAEAGDHAELIINATGGMTSLDALHQVGANKLEGKVLLDVSVPLIRSTEKPPVLTVSNTDSVGEQIQRAFPGALVVKSLNTVWCEIMINPARLPGHHDMFIAGNAQSAKRTVTGLLEQFGWPADSIIDLGDITGARAMEMYSRLTFALAKQWGHFDFNLAIVRRLA